MIKHLLAMPHGTSYKVARESALNLSIKVSASL